MPPAAGIPAAEPASKICRRPRYVHGIRDDDEPAARRLQDLPQAAPAPGYGMRSGPCIVPAAAAAAIRGGALSVWALAAC